MSLDTSYINNLLNTSKAKITHQFSKSQRFQKTPAQWTDKIYDLPTGRDQRATTQGFGNKIQILNKSMIGTPSPTTYFQNNSCMVPSKSKGISFGLSRKDVVHQNIFSEKQLRKDQPSPQHYPQRSTMSSISYSMRPRTSTMENKQTCRQTPGPIYPDKLALNASGRYCVSTYRCRGVTFINPPDSSRSPTKKMNNSPGIISTPPPLPIGTPPYPTPNPYPYPSSLQQVPDNIRKGQYFMSRMKSSKVRTFSRAQRVMYDVDNKKPGPGHYQLFSQFGTCNQVQKKMPYRKTAFSNYQTLNTGHNQSTEEPRIQQTVPQVKIICK